MKLLGPFTGAKFLRIPYQRYIVNLRASYIDETAAMVNYFVVNLLYTRISIFLQDDSFGMAGHEGLELALQAQRLAIYGEGRYTRNTMDVEQGLQDIKKAVEDLSLGPPEAIVMIGAYSPLAKFVKLAKLEWPNVRFCTVSFVGSIPFSEALGDEESRKNVFVTQVVPRPTDTSIPIVQRYQAALLEEDPNEQVGFGSLEGYLVGKII